ncbi:MAG: hypothetical protein K8S20_08410 [Chloroflexi bacterium]|nr:hypothetical protein [Chloroflexota bacterium]
MKKESVRRITASILVLILTTVCNLPQGGTPTPPPASAPTDYMIPPTTKVMDASLQSSLQSVSEDGVTLTFSASSPLLEDLEAGDVLVSDATQAAPYGLLRKVVSKRTEGGQVIVETADAELIEAVHEGHAATVRDLRPEDIRSSWFLPGVTFSEPGRAGQSIMDTAVLGPQPLSYSIDTDFGTGGRVKVVGNASLEPKLETDLNISCNDKVFGVCAEIPDLNFMTRIGIFENVSLNVKGDVSSFHKKIEIARHEFSPFTLWIGPVPVVFVPILSIYLQGDGELSSKLDYAIGQKMTLAAGFSYNSDTGFKDLSEASFDFLKPNPSFNGQVDLRGVIGGEFKLLLYGAIGPFASLEAGPRFRANPAGMPSEGGALWKAEGCIWLFVGIDSVKVIKLRYQKELYKACTGIASGINQPPLVSIQSPHQGSQVYQGEPVKLRASAMDVDGGQLNCRWSSDVSGDPFPINDCERGSVTFNTVGTRTLRLTATDPAGASASASVSLEVLPPPNILVTIDNPQDGGSVGPDESITLSGFASGGQDPYRFKWSFAYPTDAAGNGGTEFEIGSGSSLAWAPSNTVSFGGCEVNGFGRLILDVQDANGFTGRRTILIAITRIC